METLKTKRLILRSWRETDLEDLYEYAKVDGVGEMAGWKHHDSLATSKAVLNGFISEDEVYAVQLKATGKVIGSVGLHHKTMDEQYKADEQREIGYVISKAYWGLGLIPEAVKAVIEYAIEKEAIDVLWCGHFEYNHRSQRVVEKCGFRFYGDGIYDAKMLEQQIPEKQYLLTKEMYWADKNLSER